MREVMRMTTRSSAPSQTLHRRSREPRRARPTEPAVPLTGTSIQLSAISLPQCAPASRDRQRKVRVVFVRKAQSRGFDAKLEFCRVAVEPRLLWCGCELSEL